MVADELGDVVEGGVVAEFEVVVAGDVLGFADGGEDFGLLDGVDAQVGFEVEVGVQEVGGVAGLLGDDGQDAVEDRVAGGGGGRRGFGGDRCGRGRSRGGRRGGRGGVVADELGDVVEGGVVAEFEVVVAGDVLGFADGGEDFGLLDGVDAQVGFEVEVGVQEVGGVAGLLGDDGQDAVEDRVAGGGGGRRGFGGDRCGRGRSRGGRRGGRGGVVADELGRRG